MLILNPNFKSSVFFNLQSLLHDFRIKNASSCFYETEPALGNIQFSCSLYCIIGPVVSNVFMRGTVIRLIHLMRRMLSMGDKMITRTLASNNADHGIPADQGRFARRIKRPLSNEATKWTLKEIRDSSLAR